MVEAPVAVVLMNMGGPDSLDAVEPFLFNLFNDAAITNAVANVGGSLGRPSAIVMGRLVRIGGRIAF